MRFISSSTLSALAGLTLLVGTTVAPVLAQTNPTATPQTPAGQHHKHDRGAWAAKLNLTADQQAQIKQLHEQERAEMKGVFTPEQINKLAELKAQRATQRATQGATQGGNRRNMFASLNLTDAQKTQMRNIKQSYRQKMMALLTPAQQTQLNQMRQERKGAHTGT